jgi:homoaconitase/3-isopropylmalate dehydratase large subunit
VPWASGWLHHLGFGWATGYVFFTLAKARRVVLAGRLQPWVTGKDIVLKLLERWGKAQAQGMSSSSWTATGSSPWSTATPSPT